MKIHRMLIGCSNAIINIRGHFMVSWTAVDHNILLSAAHRVNNDNILIKVILLAEERSVLLFFWSYFELFFRDPIRFNE